MLGSTRSPAVATVSAPLLPWRTQRISATSGRAGVTASIAARISKPTAQPNTMAASPQSSPRHSGYRERGAGGIERQNVGMGKRSKAVPTEKTISIWPGP